MSEIVRKLATIEKITAINPIEGADSIDVADVRGWKVVIRKDQFKVGDLVIYCEIDSVMPQRSEFEFLEPRKYRIRTTKLRGQISQGIIFSLDILLNVKDTIKLKKAGEDSYTLYFDEKLDDESMMSIVEGMDITELLDVTKYEYPIPAELSGKVIGEFPSHSIKTDEERIQNLMEQWNSGELHKYMYWATEKLDGSSCTCFIVNDKFGITSRNLELKETDSNSFWKAARELDVENKMRNFMKLDDLKSLTLQGELIGEGIQKNRYKLKGQTIRFFRMFNPETYTFFDYEDFLEWMEEMDLETVPIVDYNFKLPEKIEDILEYVQDKSKLSDSTREGIVFVVKRPKGKNHNGRISFKVISNKFLLKHGE